ncbi:MAG TPA: RNA methyltransferase [Thermoprotei archaeon]|nr:RNA methyltransferase [Thermoprotei archaeon]
MNIKRKELTRIIESIPTFSKPKVYFEQYVLPGNVASRLLWIAETVYGDISNNIIIDLGCGTGRLSVGAALLGAEYVISVDVDFDAVALFKNVLYSDIFPKVSSKIDIVCADVRFFNIVNREKISSNRKVIVIQNPPFGVHRKGYDVLFLSKALELAHIVYTLHKSSTKDYVINYIENKKFVVTELFKESIRIPMMYSFHRKRFHKVNIVALRCERRNY